MRSDPAVSLVPVLALPVAEFTRRVALNGTREITRLLEAAAAGDGQADNELFDRVYSELRKIARAHRRHWHGNETLNTTALISEAYVKLASQPGASFEDRTHFYATASKAMRHILINYAERRNAAKRGGGVEDLRIDDLHLADDAAIDDLFELDSLLQQLERDSPRRCRIVECRVFGGMTISETGQALGVSPATVKREWGVLSAWLYREMHSSSPSLPVEPRC